jgi:hypothetical protein
MSLNRTCSGGACSKLTVAVIVAVFGVEEMHLAGR